MATEVQNQSEQSITSLVGGIVSDVQDLVKQQLQLLRKEVEADFQQSLEAASLWALGIGGLALGAIQLCLMLSFLLYWLASPPPADPAAIPLWGCFGIVGVVLVSAGWGLMLAGRTKFRAVHPLDNPATEALKENVQWLTTPK